MAPEIRLTAEWVAARRGRNDRGRRPRGGFLPACRSTRGRSAPASCTSGFAAIGSTALISRTRRWPRERPGWWCRGNGRAPRLSAGPGRQADSTPVTIAVDDTTVALQALAHAVRVESGAKVVAITGSAGKTTTKEVTAEFLGAKYRVIRNRGNFNNHIGLPLSLIELTARPDVAVVELGMNHAGEISTLVRIAEPDVRVWTNVGDAHVGFFGSMDAIADAKAEILEAATPDTVLVANADDDRIAAQNLVVCRTSRHIRDRAAGGGSRRGGRRSRHRRHERAGEDAARRDRSDDPASWTRQPGERAGGDGRRRSSATFRSRPSPNAPRGSNRRRIAARWSGWPGRRPDRRQLQRQSRRNAAGARRASR